MGKKQAQKDRGYVTATEWRTEGGGFKGSSKLPFKRLPFHCCAITFTPFEEPVCTEDGTVMDVMNAVPYVMKYKRHPVTGQSLHLRDLVKLTFHRNSDGEYNCPVMNKVFTEHTHIVAIKNTGNVYCWDAVEELNVKAKNWKDLLTDEPFTRKDIIHIQDPLNLQQRAIESFDHVQKDLHVDEEEEDGEAGKASSLRNVSEDTKRVLGALQTQEAKDAFASGGGGRRAEAARLLAAAKAAAASKGAAKASAAASSGSGQPRTATGQAAEGAGGAEAGPASGPSGAGYGDWRLRAPERSTEGPAFKPGAHTWNTEDQINPETKAVTGGKKKGGGAGAQKQPAAAEPASGSGRAAAPAGGGSGGSQTPQQWYEAQGHVRWVAGAHTTGAGSRAFTSTVSEVVTRNERQMKRVERCPAKKGYARLHTNLGDINVELHCDIVPRTCENFLALCDMGYYNNTLFHRSIRNFMIQGGDPTGTGLGGKSIYGDTFKDELDSRLLHSGRGILSMANSGQNTNGSQFFITYKSCQHLNYKHSVFGRVVGGFEVLSAMEKVPADDEDRPLQEIVIKSATVFTNPFYEMEEEEKKAEEAERKKQAQEEARASAGPATGGDPDAKFGKWFSDPAAGGGQLEAVRSGVGKYISVAALPAAGFGPGSGAGAAAAAPAAAAVASAPSASAGAKTDAELMPPPPAQPPAKKAKVAASSFGNFDAW